MNKILIIFQFEFKRYYNELILKMDEPIQIENENQFQEQFATYKELKNATNGNRRFIH